MPPLHAHILHQPEPENRRLLEARLNEGIHVTYGEPLPEPALFDILVAGRPQREHLEASPHLRMVVIPFAGLPDSTRALLGGYPDLEVHNLHYNAAPTAEMAVALLLAAAKDLLLHDRALRRGDWTGRYEGGRSVLLAGKRVLLLGFGEIGQRVGRALYALGMEVTAVRRNPAKPAPDDYPAAIHPPAELLDLLPQVDALVITLPLTEETRGLVGARELELLPEGALLINTGRGAVVEPQALYDALHRGHLRAAGLDVWYHYPESQGDRQNTAPADQPFHELDQVVMSPHRASDVREAERMRMHALARLLNAAATGQPLPNPVDIDHGY